MKTKLLKLLVLLAVCIVMALALSACGNGSNFNDSDSNDVLSGTAGLKYTFSDNGKYYTVTGYTGTDENLVIPNEYNGLPVNSIADHSFYNCLNITSVTISSNITSIGRSAFCDCSNLKEVTIGNNVTSIGTNAFLDCKKLEKIYLPEKLKSIGDYAFSGCVNLVDITIPSKVSTIGTLAFWDCYKLIEIINKSSLNITAGSTNYGYVAYYAKNVIMNEHDSNIVERSDLLFYNDHENYYLVKYSGTSENVILPDKINKKSYSIYQYAFYGCQDLTTIIIPQNVNSIGERAFDSCSNLTIYAEIKSQPSEWHNEWNSSNCYVIWGYIEGNCNHNILIIDGLLPTCTKVGLTDGEKCSICNEIIKEQKEIPALGHTVEIISGKEPTCITTGLTDGEKCSVCGEITKEQKEIPATGIHAWVENMCSICGKLKPSEGLDFTINDDGKSYSVTGIGSCTDIDLVIPAVYNDLPVTRIGDRAFSNCSSLTSITIPDSVTIIDIYAFYCCTGLTNLNIPDSVTSICERAFCGCVGLTSITIPDSVTGIANAFSGCTGLTSITIPSSVTIIDYESFSGCTGLASITISSSVTRIGHYAFYNCSSLTSITIPDSVTSIGNYAFYNCSSLNAVYITDIAKWCNIDFYSTSSNPLYYAHNLYLNGELVTDLVIPDGVTDVKFYAFYNCTYLSNITIPDSVTSIGYSAFSGCSKLIQEDNGIYYVEKWIIDGDASLESAVLRSDTKGIAAGAFANCTSLSSIIIPDSVTLIGWGAFYGGSNLTFYVEATSQPSGWDNTWNYSNRPVVWGYKGE